uniref:interferon-induced protein 44-like isoform X1 n=1 Tax=Styela clava TaxID=7725 RepID=UPI00193A718B|nr:interferon-induced protein 44-like isoform X1 [Styela clava]XP_039268468.1 interferon-induced protein 44-like isoform X1 [Styela clava]
MGAGASKVASAAINAKMNTMLSQGSLMKTEWRTLSWDEQTRSTLIESIREYKPLNQVGVSAARILLLGPVNVGKSSYFNTINSIFRNHVTAQAAVGSPLDEASITTKLRAYQIRNGREGKVLNFRIVDTMGLEEERKQGFDPSELPYILDGHVPENHQFDNKGNISQEMHGYIKLPKLSDKIHCCVIVLDANSISNMGEGLLHKISDMRGKITSRGIPMIILLTKIDKACSQTASNVSMVYRSSVIQNIVAQTSIKIGVPVSFILPVKNYTHEIELDPWVDALALSALQQMLRFTDNYFDECLSTSETGYVQPDKPSSDLWTRNATLPNSGQVDRPKQIWSPNGVGTPTAVAERIPNSVTGSMLHRQRLSANDSVRASPKIAGVASPRRENLDEVAEENKVKDTTAQDVDDILADDDVDIAKQKSPAKLIEGALPIPGAVPQEAA